MDAINEIFSLLNNIGLSFGVLSLVKEVHERVDGTYLKVDSIMKGNNILLNRSLH